LQAYSALIAGSDPSAHRLVCHSTLGLRVIKKKKKKVAVSMSLKFEPSLQAYSALIAGSDPSQTRVRNLAEATPDLVISNCAYVPPPFN